MLTNAIVVLFLVFLVRRFIMIFILHLGESIVK